VDSGVISFTGPFRQQAAVLSFGLRGLTDFGHIGITGQAPLNGTLEANLKAGFQPNAGNTSALINYGSRSGGFTNRLLPILTRMGFPGRPPTSPIASNWRRSPCPT